MDQLDESLAGCDVGKVFQRVLGGAFVQQITSKGGELMSQTEQEFTTLTLGVKDYANLEESLASSIKGDLLEGPNAYYCEKIKSKVDAIKRTCVNRLPKMLMIHLQRFEYDWSVETRFKLNDHFEFPIDLDMRPYTVAGLAEAAGKDLSEDSKHKLYPPSYYQYKLVGVLVHSGTAEAGHYYSYAKQRGGEDDSFYIFDDTRVEQYDLEARPARTPPFVVGCASACAAPTLTAAGQSRLALSLRQERLRAALSHGRRKGACHSSKTMYSRRLASTWSASVGATHASTPPAGGGSTTATIAPSCSCTSEIGKGTQTRLWPMLLLKATRRARRTVPPAPPRGTPVLRMVRTPQSAVLSRRWRRRWRRTGTGRLAARVR